MKTTNEMDVVLFLTNNYEIRKETFEGKAFIVVPVVMMVEGVHNGSGGPVLHTAQELGRIPGSWDGIPVTIHHPREADQNVSANSPQQIEQSVGRVFYTHMDGNKLKAEAWLDVQKLAAISPEALEYIQNNRPLDVSVGVFTDNDIETGIHNGKTYESIARNHRPDHLALLPNGAGACGWQDGCGIRVNSKGGIKMDLLKTLKEVNQLGYSISLMANAQGYREITEKIQSKLNGFDNEEKVFYLAEVYETHFIYEIRGRQSGSSVLYKRNYSVNDNEVTFADNPVEVRREVSYVTMAMRRTINVNNNDDENKGGNEMTECCKKKVDALIANGLSNFTEANRGWLEGLEETQIDLLNPKVPVVPEVNQEKALEVLSATLKTPEDYIAVMPEAMKVQFTEGLKLYNDDRKTTIDAILANAEAGVWEESELQAMEDSMLKKISKSIKAPADYSVNGSQPGKHKEEAEKMLPYGVNESK